MTINNAVSAMAGVIVMISLLLGSEVITSAFFQNSNWLWLTGFVGFNLLQSIELLTNGCHALADKAIKDFEVNEERLTAWLCPNFSWL